jgi:protein-disulfide isomerase
MSKLSVPISAEDHIQGDPSAECSLVEYGDYECPYCGAAYSVVKQIQKQFGKHLSFVFRNFPMAQIHLWAESAAEVAEFAGSHGKFWEMHDLLYQNQARLGDDLFLQLTKKLQLPLPQLQSAIDQQTYRPKLRSDFAGGVRSGVNGTPTFFINGHRHNGSFAFDSLVTNIEETLNGQIPR